MEDPTKQAEHRLREDIYGAIDDVSQALETAEQRKLRGIADVVTPLVERYQQLVLDCPTPGDRDRLERGLGRLVTDLRRRASQLPQNMSGSKAELAKDIGQPFLLRREPSPFVTKQPATIRPLRTTTPAVGKDVEAWCGRCQEMRTHRIVVMGERSKPQKVECSYCRSQHSYKQETGGKSAPASAAARAKTLPKADPEAAKKRDDREKLHAELMAASDVKMFDPHATYKAGMLVEHPKYGRGKIETVTRGSVLIRFVDGLRPMMRG